MPEVLRCGRCGRDVQRRYERRQVLCGTCRFFTVLAVWLLTEVAFEEKSEESPSRG